MKQENKYGLFFTGLCSTPDSIGLINRTTNEIISEISTSRPSGKETRRLYDKYSAILKRKYPTF